MESLNSAPAHLLLCLGKSTTSLKRLQQASFAYQNVFRNAFKIDVFNSWTEVKVFEQVFGHFLTTFELKVYQTLKTFVSFQDPCEKIKPLRKTVSPFCKHISMVYTSRCIASWSIADIYMLGEEVFSLIGVLYSVLCRKIYSCSLCLCPYFWNNGTEIFCNIFLLTFQFFDGIFFIHALAFTLL